MSALCQKRTRALPHRSSKLFRRGGRAACLLHHVKLHLNDAALDHSQIFRRRLRQVDYAPANVRPSVIDADHDRAAVGDVRYAQASAKWQRRMRGCHRMRVESFPASRPLVLVIEARHAIGRFGFRGGMCIHHCRCRRVGFSRDRHFSHDGVTGDVTGRCSAKIQRCLPGRCWNRRRRSELRFVLDERRGSTGRKRSEDRNDRSERHIRRRVSLRSARDHGCETITTDCAPAADRHAPPPNTQNPTADRGRTGAAIGQGGTLITDLLGVWPLCYTRENWKQTRWSGHGSAERTHTLDNLDRPDT